MKLESSIFILYFVFCIISYYQYSKEKPIYTNFITPREGIVEIQSKQYGVITFPNSCYYKNTIYTKRNITLHYLPNMSIRFLSENITVDSYDNLLIPFNSHGTANIFHCIENLSPIIDLALYPKKYINVRSITITGSIQSPYCQSFLKLMLSLIPSIRLLIIGGEEKNCYNNLIVNYRRCSKHRFYMFRDLHSTRLFKTKVYKLFNATFENKGICRLLFIKRNNKRRITNWDELFINRTYLKENTTIVSLENYSPEEQWMLFFDKDIVIATHGAALVNIIFMQPKSYVLEIFPPFFYITLYQHLAVYSDLFYSEVHAIDNTYPLCKPSEIQNWDKRCNWRLFRDKDFNIDVNSIENGISMAIEVVKLNKKKDMVIWK